MLLGFRFGVEELCFRGLELSLSCICIAKV